MSNINIDIEEFKKLPTEAKLDTLFKTIISHIEEIEKRFDAGRARFEKLEGRKVTDKVYAAMGGIVGGVLASLGIKYGNG